MTTFKITDKPEFYKVVKCVPDEPESLLPKRDVYLPAEKKMGIVVVKTETGEWGVIRDHRLWYMLRAYDTDIRHYPRLRPGDIISVRRLPKGTPHTIIKLVQWGDMERQAKVLATTTWHRWDYPPLSADEVERKRRLEVCIYVDEKVTAIGTALGKGGEQ